jgi:hypothetical protein
MLFLTPALVAHAQDKTRGNPLRSMLEKQLEQSLEALLKRGPDPKTGRYKWKKREVSKEAFERLKKREQKRLEKMLDQVRYGKIIGSYSGGKVQRTIDPSNPGKARTVTGQRSVSEDANGNVKDKEVYAASDSASKEIRSIAGDKRTGSKVKATAKRTTEALTPEESEKRKKEMEKPARAGGRK